MSKYSVHLNSDIGDDSVRNDYLIHVNAKDVFQAVTKAKIKLAKMMEFEDENSMSDCEVTDVYEGHIKSLWNRSKQRPIKGQGVFDF